MSRGRIFSNALMVAIFAVVCIVGMEFLAINIGQPKPFIHGYRVKAVFDDANGIPTAADVRVAGVQVGKVISVDRVTAQTASDAHANPDQVPVGKTVVTMEINDDHVPVVYSNGTAMIKPKTLLGEKYIDLTVGDATGTPIPDQGVLFVTNTSKTVENDEIFNAFDAQTRADQQKVLKALDAATTGRAGDIQAILPQLQTVVNDLDPVARVYEKDNPTVDSIFVNLNTVMQTLADEQEQLAGLLANGNTALGAIAQRDQALVSTFREAGNVSQEFNTAMAPTVSAQQQSLQLLQPALQSESNFFDQVIGNHCGNDIKDPSKNPNHPCGIEEVFTGTLLGQINYPNDQLTVTSPEGELVANEYSSMFSAPANSETSGNPNVHSALNIVLSFHCDTIQSTLQPVLGASPQLNQAFQTACQTVTQSRGPVGASYNPATGQSATAAAGLFGGLF